MTDFGDEICIGIDSLYDHYRLPVTDCVDILLINSSRNSVSSIQISDQKLLQTWTLSNPDCFTSPVVFCAADSSVCCIVEHKKLLMWQMDCESLRSAKKIKFAESVFAIIPLKGEFPVIVHRNGAITLLDSVQNDTYHAPYNLASEEELVWVDAVAFNKNIVIAQLTCRAKTNYNLRSFTVNGGAVDDSVMCVPVKQDSLSLKGYCFSSSAEQLKFLTIWSSGDLYSYSLDGTTPELLFRVPGVDAAVAVGIDVLRVSHLALVKHQNSGMKESVLEVWDLKYHILKAKKTLNQPLLKNVQIKALGSSVFLSANSSIIMVPVVLEASTLSAVVGKSTATAALDEGNTYSWSSNEKNECQIAVCEDISPVADPTKMSFKAIGKMSAKDIIQYCNQLAQSSGISEKELVGILKAVINRKDSKVDESIEDEGDDVNFKDTVLNAIFRISFSDIFLRQHLKELTFSETLVILESLLRILDRNLFCTNDNKRPTDLQIVSWIQLVIQVHFEELLLSPDKKIRKLLKKLSSSLMTKMDIYGELEQIKYLLLLTQKKKNILPDKSVHSKYCIETLHL